MCAPTNLVSLPDSASLVAFFMSDLDSLLSSADFLLALVALALLIDDLVVLGFFS